MKRFILSILLVLFASSWAGAESSVWKAQKGQTVIYLGGTCHLLRDSDYPLPPEFSRAYQASSILVFETDIAKMQDPSSQQKLLAKARYEDGSTIVRHLSARTYAELKAFSKANGIPLQSLSQLRPSMLMAALTVMELNRLGVSQEGVDQYFYGLAKKDGKTVEGLESVEEQLDYVASMADGIEDEFVSYSLGEMKNLRQQFDILADAWRRGDAGKLDELMAAEIKKAQPKLYKRLITDRNRNWLAVIEAYRKSPQTRFVLVGAAHLVGSDGIIEALKKKGYTVEKL
jgi:uncharacterized protein YbaP (TraB family)